MDTKKLRQKILDLAIHGKLVPQDPNDEPASVLLERIRAEKEALIKEGNIKRAKKTTTSDTPHYENVPEGWVLTDIGELLTNRDSERIPLSLGVRSKQENKIYDYYGATGVVDKVDGYLFDERLLLIGEDGANLLSRSKDNAFFAEGKYWVNNHAHILDCQEKEVLDYVAFLINSMSLEEYITGSAQPKLNQDNLNKIEIPLPPLEEQRRIIAQVNLWQSYIKDLETSETELLESVESAKSKILDLAIHGKLVPQNSTDEPASELLKHINPKAIITGDNPHYQIPSNWTWTTLGAIGKWQSGGTPSRMHKEYYGGHIPWLKTGDLNDGIITEIPERITELGLENSSAKLNPVGSILIAMYGATIGKVGILGIPATTNQACCACVEYKCVTQKFLFYFLISHKDKFIALGGGGAQPNISKEIITKTPMPIPPIEEQLRIVEKIEKLYSQLDFIKESLQA